MSASDSGAERSAVDASTELAPKATLEAEDAPNNKVVWDAQRQAWYPVECCDNCRCMVYLQWSGFDWSAVCEACHVVLVNRNTYTDMRAACASYGYVVVAVRRDVWC